jgi:hypothetical protein
MLHNAADQSSDLSAIGLRTAYEEMLRSVISAAGVDTVAAETGIEADRLNGLTSGAQPTLTVTEAASILAVDEELPDTEAIVYELRDHLLMGMTTAVLDVDTVAANLDVDLSGQEVQQAIEGRIEMTLAQLAAIQSVIDGRNEN